MSLLVTALGAPELTYGIFLNELTNLNSTLSLELSFELIVFYISLTFYLADSAPTFLPVTLPSFPLSLTKILLLIFIAFVFLFPWFLSSKLKSLFAMSFA